jgi:hypothetical protein
MAPAAARRGCHPARSRSSSPTGGLDADVGYLLITLLAVLAVVVPLA